jgi:1-deoxy-D-xylulose-5-phosphate synthase
MTGLLDTRQFPEDLKHLSYNDLLTLAAEIRERLIDVTNAVGGHLASNLGVVELTLAMHTVFNTPEDCFLWDTSHQTYVHKMLTGRLQDMYTIKQWHGLSGFAKRSESDHDCFGAGHASTSLSAAIGIAHARNATKTRRHVVCVLGDGGLSGGMTYEALNNIRDLTGNFICILNDNDMSISPPVGAMAHYITSIRSTSLYDGLKSRFEGMLNHIPSIGTPLLRRIDKVFKHFRSGLLDVPAGVLFEEFGFKYLGPIDGHDLRLVTAMLHYAKTFDGPIMIHVITKKGKGLAIAEANPVQYHGVSANTAKKSSAITYTQCFGEEIVAIAATNDRVHVITPAMREGSGLVAFENAFPDRYYDVGIAEEHAVTFAAGLSVGGLCPVLAIYSTFLQRGFDQVIHDVCLQNLPMVFAIDRAGLVGADGPTHHGVFDISYLNLIPNMVICAPKDGTELRQMLQWAVTSQKIVSIRYPRGSVPAQDGQSVAPIEWGKCQLLKTAPTPCDILLLAVGYFAWPAVGIADTLTQTEGASVTVVNLRFVKPLDMATIEPLLAGALVCVLEDGAQMGGAYHGLLNACRHLNKPLSDWVSFAIPDTFIDHGSVSELQAHIGLSADQITETIRQRYRERCQS